MTKQVEAAKFPPRLWASNEFFMTLNPYTHAYKERQVISHVLGLRWIEMISVEEHTALIAESEEEIKCLNKMVENLSNHIETLEGAFEAQSKHITELLIQLEAVTKHGWTSSYHDISKQLVEAKELLQKVPLPQCWCDIYRLTYGDGKCTACDFNIELETSGLVGDK